MAKNIKKFTEDPRVLQVLKELNEERYKNKYYSDIIDANGNQYVDLVLEGGGVLGMALVGFIYVLEKMKIRFLGLGGTSAGSIITLLLACKKIEEEKVEWILKELSKIDFNQFLDFHDGDTDAKILVKLLDKNSSRVKRVFHILKLIDNLEDGYKRKGLVKGDAFKSWLEKVIGDVNEKDEEGKVKKGKGIKSVNDLIKIRSIEPEGLKKREGTSGCSEFKFDEKCQKVAIIAANISTEANVEFPEKAKLYWKDWESINPVEFVRASMSIPLLFNPYEIGNIEHTAERWSEWERDMDYRGKVPEKVYFVDGGIISNFPINIFHKSNGVPGRPTFGVKLGDDRTEVNEIKSLASLLAATFSTARHSLDNDYIKNNKDYNQIVTYINTKDFNWLNFSMEEMEKINLFCTGAEAAGEFLKRFDWEYYKDFRKSLLNPPDIASSEKPAVPQKPPQN